MTAKYLGKLEMSARVCEAERQHSVERQTRMELWPELVHDYPRKLVAILDRRVVASADDLFEMDRQLDRLGFGDSTEVQVDYVWDGTENFIL